MILKLLKDQRGMMSHLIIKRAFGWWRLLIKRARDHWKISMKIIINRWRFWAEGSIEQKWKTRIGLMHRAKKLCRVVLLIWKKIVLEKHRNAMELSKYYSFNRLIPYCHNTTNNEREERRSIPLDDRGYDDRSQRKSTRGCNYYGSSSFHPHISSGGKDQSNNYQLFVEEKGEKQRVHPCSIEGCRESSIPDSSLRNHYLHFATDNQQQEHSHYIDISEVNISNNFSHDNSATKTKIRCCPDHPNEYYASPSLVHSSSILNRNERPVEILTQGGCSERNLSMEYTTSNEYRIPDWILNELRSREGTDDDATSPKAYHLRQDIWNGV